MLPSMSCRDSTVALRYQAVERVILAMHERLDESLSLQDMAEIAALSPYHFNRVFRQITGIPPSQFLYALRLKAAKRLLLTTQLSVTEVCYEVGYNSLGTFVTRFTQLVGLPPSHLRHMAAQVTMPCWESLHAQVAQRILAQNLGFTGRIIAPDAFTGLIFVGLFSTAIPKNRPISCALLTSPGIYHLTSVPDGRYYVFAAALPWSYDPLAYMLNETKLQGVAGPLLVCGGQVSGHTDLTLQPAQLTNPPLLIALPFLLFERLTTERALTA